MKIRVLGIDPSFANMGFCVANIYNGKTDKIIIDVLSVKLVSTEGRDKKEVRKSSDDLRRAKELHTALHGLVQQYKPQIVFSEVPHGSQSARSAWALGISVGILASCPVTLIQVSALEVKLASVGKKTASKDDMIQWATTGYPQVNWLRHGQRYTKVNEHLADALATIFAGTLTDEFTRLMTLVSADTPVLRNKLK